MKTQRVGIISYGVSHRWVCDRNGKRGRAEMDSYQEIGLSELMAVMGCSLISVYIHESGGDYGEGGNNFIGFLQADAICVKNDGRGHFFVIPIPSRFDGGHGRDCLSETLPGTVWDDIIIRFDRIPEGHPRSSFPPTWIAAVREDNVVELYGGLIDYCKAGPFLPSIMKESASFDYDFASEYWVKDPWDQLISLCDFPGGKVLAPKIRKQYFKFYRGEDCCPDKYLGTIEGTIWAAEKGVERIWDDIVSGCKGTASQLQSRIEQFVEKVLIESNLHLEQQEKNLEYYRKCRSVD